MTELNDVEKYLATLPPSHVNNSRAIIRSKIASFNRSPSESKAQEIENLTGGALIADYRAEDSGEGPRGGDYQD